MPGGTAPAAVTPPRRNTYARRGDGKVLQKVSLYLPQDVAAEFKRACVAREGGMGGVFRQLVEGWLSDLPPS